MKSIATVLLAFAVCSASIPAPAAQDEIPALSHVFLIIMENHGFDKEGNYPPIIGNKDAPYINRYMVNNFSLATNYLSVGHPSLANYLEIVGGSNFATYNDLPPNWKPGTNNPSTYDPIPASGIEVPSNYCHRSHACDNDKLGYEIRGGDTFVGKTIADQLAEAKKTWKTYQESLPANHAGGAGVDASDGKKTNLDDPQVEPLYAAKHNPFEYFSSTRGNIAAIAGYASDLDKRTLSGPLAEDLAAGTVANFNFIVPNQRHDMHGTKQFKDKQKLIQDGDREIEILVNAITGSPAWKTGKNVIIVMWDEDDYSPAGNNRVPVFIGTNYGAGTTPSSQSYNHFSLLKTLENGFGLDYLNHAKDASVRIMSDMLAP